MAAVLADAQPSLLGRIGVGPSQLPQLHTG